MKIFNYTAKLHQLVVKSKQNSMQICNVTANLHRILMSLSRNHAQKPISTLFLIRDNLRIILHKSK